MPDVAPFFQFRQGSTPGNCHHIPPCVREVQSRGPPYDSVRSNHHDLALAHVLNFFHHIPFRTAVSSEMLWAGP
ncbi:hypothetical protein D3C73_1580610 [compost metagenome]